MQTKLPLLCLALIAASLVCTITAPASDAVGDTFSYTYTRVTGAIPHTRARIVSYHAHDRTYHDLGPAGFAGTGDLVIHYSDGIDVLAWKAPNNNKVRSLLDNEQVGVDQIKVAKNRRTIGWENVYVPCCESYSLAEDVAIYQSAKRVLYLGSPGMIYYWAFTDHGQRIVAVWGPAHGPQVLDYQMIDIKTPRVIAEVFGDPKTQELDSDAPAWALRAQTAINGR